MRSLSTLTLLFSVCSSGWWRVVTAVVVNVTVDDTDPSILYRPLASWHASGNSCPTCLQPNTSLAYNGTWHDGTASSRLDNSPNVQNPNGPMSMVVAQLEFTGSSVYLYCIQPLHLASINSTPTNMNLTFILDGHVTDVYIHSGSESVFGFSPHINVFMREGLLDAHHILQINVGPDSVFLFDYMEYSRSIENISTTTVMAPSTSTAQSNIETSKRSNAGTFGGAVGGSVGVLTIFAFGLALNLFRLRLMAARRDRRDRQQDELLRGNTDGARMHGPAPFVPRYFPGTVPTAPPPYVPHVSASHSHASSSESVPYVSLPQHPVPLPYADLPPATPPPPLEDGLTVSAPPPPFGAVTATPVPAVPQDVSLPLNVDVAGGAIPLPPSNVSDERQ